MGKALRDRNGSNGPAQRVGGVSDRALRVLDRPANDNRRALTWRRGAAMLALVGALCWLAWTLLR